MKPYKGLSGSSGIERFKILDDAIEIQFRHSREVYGYTYEVPGEAHVEQMKQLAEAGRGLSTYISQHVKSRYAYKFTR